ncbi:hypothetical protein KPH14_002579 [Odynerus spinipes]|uniref:Uncharacterized protein n=1 Tax=Odynerus spinipes TaxID=1348599 RepID=A0AAD9R9X7_9HYME|nr:hypothetical protein KPH14_002579 [Odynerus spinipes]
MLFRTTLRVPGEFFGSGDPPANPQDFAKKFRHRMRAGAYLSPFKGVLMLYDDRWFPPTLDLMREQADQRSALQRPLKGNSGHVTIPTDGAEYPAGGASSTSTCIFQTDSTTAEKWIIIGNMNFYEWIYALTRLKDTLRIIIIQHNVTGATMTISKQDYCVMKTTSHGSRLTFVKNNISYGQF